MKNKIPQSILDVIYPVRCPICGNIVTPKKEKICENCKKKLNYIKEPRCKKCSKPIDQEEKEYCRDCLQKNLHYVKGFSVWTYDENMKKSISEFKYHSRKEYAIFYIQEMVRLYGDEIQKIAPDIIVPIPLHRSKKRERGFNQAEILAYGFGRELDIPMIPQLLIRNKKTTPQKQLSDRERLSNLQEAFELNDKVMAQLPPEVNKILLVDDIYTTGSTIESCARVLVSQGVSKIYFITVCIGKGF